MQIYEGLPFFQCLTNVLICSFYILEVGQWFGLAHWKPELAKLHVYGLFSGVKSNWFRSGVKVNQHPPAHLEGWIVSDQETIFYWVPFFLRLVQWQSILFCGLLLCGLLVLVSLPMSMLVCKLEFAFALEEGMVVHEHIIESVSALDVYVGNNLVDMHAKCGAFKMLGDCSTRCPCLRMLHLLHVKHGNWQKALELFQQIHNKKV